jgi:hypothetical protein
VGAKNAHRRTQTSPKKKIFFQPNEKDGIVLVSRITTDEETINGVAPSVVATQEKIQDTGFCG